MTTPAASVPVSSPDLRGRLIETAAKCQSLFCDDDARYEVLYTPVTDFNYPDDPWFHCADCTAALRIERAGLIESVRSIPRAAALIRGAAE